MIKSAPDPTSTTRHVCFAGLSQGSARHLSKIPKRNLATAHTSLAILLIKANRANLFAEVESSMESADDSTVAASSVVTFCGKIECGYKQFQGKVARTYLGLWRRAKEAAAARGVAITLMEGEAGGDPGEHQGQVAEDGQASEYAKQTIPLHHQNSSRHHLDMIHLAL